MLISKKQSRSVSGYYRISDVYDTIMFIIDQGKGQFDSTIFLNSLTLLIGIW